MRCRVEDTESDIQCIQYTAENDPVQEDGKISLNLKESELKVWINITLY